MKKHCFLILGLFTLIFMFAGIGVFATEGEPTLEICAKALELEATTGISFAVPTEPAKGADVKLLVWNEPRTDGYLYGTQNYILDPSDEDTVDGVLCTVFTYDGLAAKQMTDNIYVRAYAVVGGNPYYSNTEKYSILQYAYNKLGKTDEATDDEKLKSTLTALLEYGAKAQLLFDYNTDRLANSSFYQLSVVDGCIASDLSCNGLYLTGEQVAFIANAENGESVPFSHWENSAGETVGEEVCLSVTVGNTNEVYTAIYETIETAPPTVQKVAIEVINGNITSSSNDQLYEIGSEIELVANENDSACFAYWQTASGEILSEDSTYTVTVGENAETYTAVYATEYEYFGFEIIGEDSCSIYGKADIYPQNSIIIPKYYDGKLVTEIAIDAFKNNGSIQSVWLHNSIKHISNSAFLGCSKLTKIWMSHSVETIGDYAFKQCSKLVRVLGFEDCVSLTIIGKETFSGCLVLENIILPNSITTIKQQAFYNCKALTIFTIPYYVSTIEEYAFGGCTNLFEVLFLNQEGWLVYGDTPLKNSDITNYNTAATLLTTKYNDGEWTRKK